MIICFIAISCDENFEFESYEILTVEKNDLIEEKIILKLTKEEKDEIFALLKKIEFEKADIALDSKSYLYKIMVDEEEIIFINVEYIIFQDDLYKVKNSSNDLIKYLEDK